MDGPSNGVIVQDEVVNHDIPSHGAVHGTSYHHRFGSCEKRFPGTRRGCDRQGATAEAIAARDVLRFFSRRSPCLVGIEACATAHHWARELTKLGHTVKLMPPAYVKPYVKRGKTDAADAEAIAEAVTRPSMRFVAVKTAEQQAVLMLHKVRDLLVRQRTMLINALRGHLAEFGIIAARGPGGVTAAIAALHEAQDGLPALARVA